MERLLPLADTRANMSRHNGCDNNIMTARNGGPRRWKEIRVIRSTDGGAGSFVERFMNGTDIYVRVSLRCVYLCTPCIIRIQRYGRVKRVRCVYRYVFTCAPWSSAQWPRRWATCGRGKKKKKGLFGSRCSKWPSRSVKNKINKWIKIKTYREEGYKRWRNGGDGGLGK